MNCGACSKDVSAFISKEVSRRETCPFCSVDLHACRMCNFYDTNSYNECREPNAERIVDKEKANFCDYFEFNVCHEESGNTKEDILKKADALFKD